MCCTFVATDMPISYSLTEFGWKANYEKQFIDSQLLII